MEKEMIYTKGDIVTYDVAYVEQTKLETNNSGVLARCVQEINDDDTILLDGFFEAIPSKYVLPISIESEIAKQVFYDDIKNPYTHQDVYSIPPFMETLSTHPLFKQLQAANLQYVHEVQHWLEKNDMRTLQVNVFFGMRKPRPITFG